MIPNASPFPSDQEVTKTANSTSRKRKRKNKIEAQEKGESSMRSFFREAEICCEQARSAARLKRFDAACGLFATAQALLTRVVQAGGELRNEASERLAGVSAEMSAYRELARSTSRPLRLTKR